MDKSKFSMRCFAAEVEINLVAFCCCVQDTHSKLRRIADMIAALLVHRLETSKKGNATPGGDRKVRL